MTATTAPTAATSGPTAASVPADARITWWGVLRSEWVKFRSLRSSVVMLAAAVVVLVGLGLVFSTVFADNPPETAGPLPPGAPSSLDPLGVSLGGVNLAQLIVGTLGVLLVAGEYSTGMIRSSLAAVPRRWPVLAAKVTVFAAVTSAVLVPAVLVAFLLGQRVIGADGLALTDDGVLRAVLGSAFYLTGVGVLGTVLGALLRNTAGAITTLVALLLVVPGLTGLLPDDWSEAVGPYLPSNAGDAFMSLTTTGDLLSPGAGLAVFVGWLVVLLSAAVVTLLRRDA